MGLPARSTQNKRFLNEHWYIIWSPPAWPPAHPPADPPTNPPQPPHPSFFSLPVSRSLWPFFNLRLQRALQAAGFKGPPSALKDVLLMTADRISDLVPYVKQGRRLNVGAAVASLTIPMLRECACACCRGKFYLNLLWGGV
jgi:hypothetical protein